MVAYVRNVVWMKRKLRKHARIVSSGMRYSLPTPLESNGRDDKYISNSNIFRNMIKFISK